MPHFDSELYWIVATQAALAFSVPTWALTVDPAWPSYSFPAAVLLGATTALIVCHVLPAMCAPTLPLLLESRVGRVLRWPIAAALGLGAAGSLIGLSRLGASLFLFGRDVGQDPDPIWIGLLHALALLWVLAGIALAAQSVRRQRLVIALGIFAGLVW